MNKHRKVREIGTKYGKTVNVKERRGKCNNRNKKNYGKKDGGKDSRRIKLRDG